MSDVYVLVHRPIVGPLTWSLVAAELRRRGLEVLVPTVRDVDDPTRPCWRHQADSVAAVLANPPGARRLVLVGHSGAGQLIPAIWNAAARRAGWVCRELEGGHFHMLVDPIAVCSHILEIVGEVDSNVRTALA